MNEHDKNFIKNMSPFLIAAMVMFLMMVAYDTKADDHNITAHGHTVDEKYLTDNKIKRLYTGNIIGASAEGRDTIIIKMRSKEKYKLTVSFCWDLPFATGYSFNRPGASNHFTRVEKGLRFWTVSFGKFNNTPCIVTKVESLEVIG